MLGADVSTDVAVDRVVRPFQREPERRPLLGLAVAVLAVMIVWSDAIPGFPAAAERCTDCGGSAGSPVSSRLPAKVPPLWRLARTPFNMPANDPNRDGSVRSTVPP